MILGTIAGIFQNIYSVVLRHVPRLSLSCFRFAFYEHFWTFFDSFDEKSSFSTALSHIPQFGDANTSLARDAHL